MFAAFSLLLLLLWKIFFFFFGCCGCLSKNYWFYAAAAATATPAPAAKRCWCRNWKLNCTQAIICPQTQAFTGKGTIMKCSTFLFYFTFFVGQGMKFFHKYKYIYIIFCIFFSYLQHTRSRHDLSFEWDFLSRFYIQFGFQKMGPSAVRILAQSPNSLWLAWLTAHYRIFSAICLLPL